MYYSNMAKPGNTVRVEELPINVKVNKDGPIKHRTVVPSFSDVAGTVRVDCTVPDDDTTVCSVISRSTMFG